MDGSATRQRDEIVTAFEYRDDAAARAPPRDLHKLSRYPGEIGDFEMKAADRVEAMSVETGRYHDQIGREGVDAGEDFGRHRLAEKPAGGAGRQRRIDDRVAGPAFVRGAGAGIERHLMRRGVKHRTVRPENLLRAIAVMHVEIDDRHALGAVNGLRLAGCDRSEIKEAEPHRPRCLGVMAGRPHGHEGVIDPARHDLVHGEDAAAHGMRDRLPGAWAHHDIFRNLDQPRRGSGGLDALDVIGRVDAKKRLLVDPGRQVAMKHLENLALERPFEHEDPIGALRVSGAGIVFEAGGMAD